MMGRTKINFNFPWAPHFNKSQYKGAWSFCFEF
jgi:hypothetical protein